ncbi:MAG: EamA family transporter [Desulfuromonadales bacterium]|nr:EamA family transporter [Desulfuromonadales bacterium]
MIYLFLSIICSVAVGILLKIAKKHNNTAFFQMIGWNYFFAAVFCFAVYRPEMSLPTNIPYETFLPLMILLPTIFLIQANSIKHTGIVRTDIAQRLSLIISLSAAYVIFKENISALKFSGLVIGLISIFFVLSREKTNGQISGYWYLPAAVLVGFGMIDIFFKKVALFTSLQYTSSLFLIFCGAFSLSVLIILFQIIFQKQKLNLKNLYWGAGLGILNFGNILFYLRAHKILKDNPSTVFACMNFGVIILGSLVGIAIFKERLSKINYLGLVLAIVAVVVITIAQNS